MIYRFLLVSMAAFFGLGAASGADTAELFGRADDIWSAQVSPDGAWVATGCAPQGRRAICLFDLENGTRPRLIPPPGNARIMDIFWASHTHLIYRVNLFERLSTSSGLRELTSRRALSYSLESEETSILMGNINGLTNTSVIDSLLPGDTDKVLMAVTLRMDTTPRTGRRVSQKSDYQYVSFDVDLDNGKARVRERSPRSILFAIHDEEGNRLVEYIRDEDRKHIQLDAIANGRRTIFESDDAAVSPIQAVEGLSMDRQSLIVDFDTLTRQGLHTIDLSDGRIARFRVNGKPVGDVGLVKDPWSQQILGYHYTDDLAEIVYTDPELANHQAALSDALGGDKVSLTSWTRDRKEFTVRALKPGRPADFYLFEPDAGALSPLGNQAAALANTALGKVQSIRYKAADGLTIPAYLTFPPGHTQGALPLVLLPHGGPEARDTAAYDWLAQAIAAQGYLVLQPNFRGSAGYGVAFRNAGHGEFGGLMIADILDGARYLVEGGLAKPGGHCAVGASYGGYAALMAGLKDGEGVRCVVSINGVSDPFSIMGRTGTSSPATSYWQQYMGDMFKTGEQEKKTITPRRRTGDFSQPVLLIHGREDTTVPFSQSRSLYDAARESGDFQLVELEAQDHYLTTTSARRQVLEQTLGFLKTHHPGR